MRHGDKINNLGRTASHRRALLSNLACQLFQYKRITTTLAKAKALRPYVEPLLTKAKENTTHQRRIVFGYLQDKEAIKELFDAWIWYEEKQAGLGDRFEIEVYKCIEELRNILKDTLSENNSFVQRKSRLFHT